MKYLLRNAYCSNIQLNLHPPGGNTGHGLHRGGPVHALNIKAGQVVDLLAYFTSVAEARAHLRASKDALKFIRPGYLYENVIDNYGREFQDVDTYLKNPPGPPETKKIVNIPVPTKQEVVDAGYTSEAADYIVSRQQQLAAMAEQGKTEEEINAAAQRIDDSVLDGPAADKEHKEDVRGDPTVPAINVAEALASQERTIAELANNPPEEE